MKLSRAWATPLTIGAFAIMSVTGVLMFFHLDSGLNKLVHEWAGWAMLAGVAMHVAVNWRPFMGYFSSRLGQAIIGIGVLALAASFIPLPGGGGRGMPPPVLAMKAVTGAPVSMVAPLTGRSLPQVMDDLAKAGIAVPSPEASIGSVIGDSREMQAKAMAVLFGKA